MDTSLPIESPSLSRRQLLNFITGATVTATAGSALYVANRFFIPPVEKTGVRRAMIAKDILENPIPALQTLVVSVIGNSI